MKQQMKRRKTVPMPEAEAKALREFIEARVSIIPITGCWMWMGCIVRGTLHASMNWWSPVKSKRGKHYKQTYPAYRLAWSAWSGQWAIGGVVDHRCEHPWCVNPAHLELVTSRTNAIRSIRHRQLHEARIRLGLPSQSRVPGMKPSGHMTF